jgi:protein-disulfide isomerase
MRKLIVAISVSFFFAAIAFAATQSTTPPPEPNLKVTKDSGGKSTSSLVTEAPLPDDYVMGKANAPITLVEYASLTCPHCAHFSNNVLPELDKKYIETGKMRYILRQFPLNEAALKGAMLLDCVGQQDNNKYYIFAKVLFDAQPKWAFDGNYMSGLETIATVGGLSRDQFANCVNNTDREMKVLKAKKLATEELRIPHTPYIFINGEVYEGDRSVEEISKFIDAKLAGKR